MRTYLVNLLQFLPPDLPLDVVLLASDSLTIPVDRPNIQRIGVNWAVNNPIGRAAWERVGLPRLLRKLKPDVLFFPGGIIGVKLPPACKSVAMFRNMLPFDPVQRRSYPLGYMRSRHWLLEKLLMKGMCRADLVIFISHFARGVIKELANGKIRNAVVIPHGINPIFRGHHDRKSPRPKWLPAEQYLLYVSRIDFYKAQVEVVRAYAMLKRRRPTFEKLVLAGPESPDYGRMLRKEIQQLGLAADVVILGQVPYEQMPALYRNAVINIFASRCENCPNILLEALAAGRPVLSSKYPPMPELAGDAALYFDPGVPADLAGQLAMVLDDAEYMHYLSVKAQEQSLLYDWGKTALTTWKVIEDLACKIPSADYDLQVVTR